LLTSFQRSFENAITGLSLWNKRAMKVYWKLEQKEIRTNLLCT